MAWTSLYQLEPELVVDEFVDVLRRSTLAERRPVDESETMRGMLRHADIIVTARSRRAAGRRLARHYRFQLLHLPVRPGRGCGVSAAGYWPRTDSTHARSSGTRHDTHSAGGSQGGQLLPAHRHDPSRLVLDRAAAVISPDPSGGHPILPARQRRRADPASGAARRTTRCR